MTFEVAVYESVFFEKPTWPYTKYLFFKAKWPYKNSPYMRSTVVHLVLIPLSGILDRFEKNTNRTIERKFRHWPFHKKTKFHECECYGKFEDRVGSCAEVLGEVCVC